MAALFYGLQKKAKSDNLTLAKKQLLEIPGKLLSARILTHQNKLRGLKGPYTVSNFISVVFDAMEVDGLGTVKSRLANNNNPVSKIF